MNHRDRDHLRIVSIDGGGIKGLYSASVLAEFEAQLGQRWSEYVDWIFGTSSGGILGLGLAAGNSAAELAHFLRTKGPSIFPNPTQGIGRHVQQAQHVLRQLRLLGKYTPGALRDGLDDLFGGLRMSELQTDVSIASVNLSNGSLVVFTRQSHPDLLVRDVALATSATPGYLPAHEIQGQLYADGGLWANSPALSGLVHAEQHIRGARRIDLLSIGTVEQPEGYETTGAPQNLPQWIQRMFHASTYGQAELTHQAVASFLPKLAPETAYIRIPPPVIPIDQIGAVRMDTTHPAALEALVNCGRAEGQIQLSNPDIRQFLQTQVHD